MNAERILRAVLPALTFAVLVVLVIASITHGDVQEFCATAVYIGAGLCAVLLLAECIVGRRRGGIAD